MDSVSTPARRLQKIQRHISQSLSSQLDPSLVLVLPAGNNITSFSSVSPKGTTHHLLLDSTLILSYRSLPLPPVALEVTSINTSFEGTIQHVPRYEIVEISSPQTNHSAKEATQNGMVSIANFWTSVYALFTVFHAQEHIPILFSGVTNVEELRRYLTTTGLGRPHQRTPGKVIRGGHEDDIMFLSRSAFWQGAGTTGYHDRAWLRWQAPTIPSIPSFTRNQNVIASHPLRPCKPQPGEVLYRRWCAGVRQTIEFTYIDLGAGDAEGPGGRSEPSKHLAAFHKWHNDERVNSAWSERGTLEAHRKYLEGVLADPGVVPCMMSWDGELMGYVEMVWVKENHVAHHYPHGVVVGDWERGLHVLVGEDKFLGRCE